MRFRDFSDYDLFPANRSRQREAVRWLQREVIRAFEQPRSKSQGFFSKIFQSDVGVHCLLRIIDPLGIAATDLVYDFVWTQNIHRLRLYTKRIERSLHLDAKLVDADRTLRLINPMQIRWVEEALTEERRLDPSNKYSDIYRYIELVLLRWSWVWSPQDHSRTNAIDSWFMKSHQAALWEHFGNRCFHCGSSPAQFRDRTIDHAFIPFSRGGTFVIFDSVTRNWSLNAIPLCRSCNSAKGTRSLESFFTPEQVKQLSDRLQQYVFANPPPTLPNLT